MAALSKPHAQGCLRISTTVQTRFANSRPTSVVDFLFGGNQEVSLLSLSAASEENSTCGRDEESAKMLETSVSILRRMPRSLQAPSPILADLLELPPFDFPNALAMLLPVAQAGLMAGTTGVAVSCIPLAVPFSVPTVSLENWIANKRARAFWRSTVIVVWAQGGLTLLRFAKGDLVGGVYEGFQAMIGYYATRREGQRIMPTYIICCGFNGVLGLLGLFQAFQGVPLQHIPGSVMIPPVLSLFGAYFAWQYCRELIAIGSGMLRDGPQDTCFVNLMGAEGCPSFLGPHVEVYNDDARDDANANLRGVAPEFQAFRGNGHRLGDLERID
eukprot:TRINITY_DN28543_c0_g1_i1.p1 TRINITY_DN28543_c0_g1~~TRINITY_DN28543_c0_g1_i1.p1  ORF type:complete len:329 (+),score=47.62 TRINITY_DN28543_c0_g1_i1:70-1056(+)